MLFFLFFDAWTQSFSLLRESIALYSRSPGLTVNFHLSRLNSTSYLEWRVIYTSHHPSFIHLHESLHIEYCLEMWILRTVKLIFRSKIFLTNQPWQPQKFREFYICVCMCACVFHHEQCTPACFNEISFALNLHRRERHPHVSYRRLLTAKSKFSSCTV